MQRTATLVAPLLSADRQAAAGKENGCSPFGLGSSLSRAYFTGLACNNNPTAVQPPPNREYHQHIISNLEYLPSKICFQKFIVKNTLRQPPKNILSFFYSICNPINTNNFIFKFSFSYMNRKPFYS